MQCVQGLLNYQPNGPKDGGLILMKGSAKLFDEFFSVPKEQGDHEDKPPPEEEMRDLFIFKEEDVEWFKNHGCTLQKIDMEPGDMVSYLVACVFSTLTITTGTLGQQDDALCSSPAGRPHPTRAVHLHDTSKVCEEGRP
jgi:hypothetical protein